MGTDASARGWLPRHGDRDVRLDEHSVDDEGGAKLRDRPRTNGSSADLERDGCVIDRDSGGRKGHPSRRRGIPEMEVGDAAAFDTQRERERGAARRDELEYCGIAFVDHRAAGHESNLKNATIGDVYAREQCHGTSPS